MRICFSNFLFISCVSGIVTSLTWSVGLIFFGLSQFLLLPQLPQKYTTHLKSGHKRPKNNQVTYFTNAKYTKSKSLIHSVCFNLQTLPLKLNLRKFDEDEDKLFFGCLLHNTTKGNLHSCVLQNELINWIFKQLWFWLLWLWDDVFAKKSHVFSYSLAFKWDKWWSEWKLITDGLGNNWERFSTSRFHCTRVFEAKKKSPLFF